MASLAMQIMAGISRKTAAENKAGSEQWRGLFLFYKKERQDQRASADRAYQGWRDQITQAQADNYLGWMGVGDGFMSQAQAKQNEAEAKTAEGDALVADGQGHYDLGAYQAAAQAWEAAALKYAEASLAYANGIEKYNEAFRCYKQALYAIVPADPTSPPPQ
jgi:hypothetical protein